MSIWIVAGFCYCKRVTKNIRIKPTGAQVQEFLLHIYTGVDLLGQRLSELSVLQDNSKLLTKVVFTNLQFQQHCIQDLIDPNPLQHLVLSDFLMFTSQIDIE